MVAVSRLSTLTGSVRKLPGLKKPFQLQGEGLLGTPAFGCTLLPGFFEHLYLIGNPKCARTFAGTQTFTVFLLRKIFCRKNKTKLPKWVLFKIDFDEILQRGCLDQNHQKFPLIFYKLRPSSSLGSRGHWGVFEVIWGQNYQKYTENTKTLYLIGNSFWNLNAPRPNNP